MLTLDQALIELAELTAPGKTYTAKQLADLAAKVSVDVASGSTQGSVTLLYSGRINDVPSTDYIGKMIKDGADIRVIDKTQVGTFLASEDFQKAYKATGASQSQLFHPTTGPWAEASARFAAVTVGEVRFMGPIADITRQFGATELPKLLAAGSQVTSIEGIAITELRAMGQANAFKAITSSSATHLGMSGFKIDANGGTLGS